MNAPSEICGNSFNVGTGKQTSLLELLDALKNITGHDFTVNFKEARTGDIKHSVSDISKAVKMLGYKPEYDIQTGLQQLLEWKNQTKL